MTDPTPNIVSDLLIVLLFSLPCALVLFALAKRQVSPENSLCKVPSEHVNAMDLTVAIALILHYVLMFTAQQTVAALFASRWLGNTNSSNALFVQLIYNFGIISLILAYYSRIRQLSLDSVLGLKRLPFWKIMLWGVCMYLLIAVVLGFMQFHYVSYLDNLGIKTEVLQDSAKSFVSTPNLEYRILFILTAVVAAPLMEELVFRGFLYPVIKRYTDVWFALIFVSLLFGAIHLHLQSLPLLAMLGLILNLAYERTGCLWVPIIIHGIFNSATLIYLSVSE